MLNDSDDILKAIAVETAKEAYGDLAKPALKETGKTDMYASLLASAVKVGG